jgi:hypothetical protein
MCSVSPTRSYTHVIYSWSPGLGTTTFKFEAFFFAIQVYERERRGLLGQNLCEQ